MTHVWSTRRALCKVCGGRDSGSRHLCNACARGTRMCQRTSCTTGHLPARQRAGRRSGNAESARETCAQECAQKCAKKCALKKQRRMRCSNRNQPLTMEGKGAANRAAGVGTGGSHARGRASSRVRQRASMRLVPYSVFLLSSLLEREQP